ncbi:hypothetical protein M917_2493 [Psychrobacter aquaticus CMS 56]|uniref:Uncharacterized protein n=1 Tax=Psychrobacter aquaticus CMS 56 TaxID=1354303 RepID=U4T1T8_9GAMM|nr:hypothetical protein M917_2493 [Psychrobacter aquaticus CMS 56]
MQRHSTQEKFIPVQHWNIMYLFYLASTVADAGDKINIV